MDFLSQSDPIWSQMSLKNKLVKWCRSHDFYLFLLPHSSNLFVLCSIYLNTLWADSSFNQRNNFDIFTSVCLCLIHLHYTLMLFLAFPGPLCVFVVVCFKNVLFLTYLMHWFMIISFEHPSFFEIFSPALNLPQLFLLPDTKASSGLT